MTSAANCFVTVFRDTDCSTAIGYNPQKSTIVQYKYCINFCEERQSKPGQDVMLLHANKPQFQFCS